MCGAPGVISPKTGLGALKWTNAQFGRVKVLTSVHCPKTMRHVVLHYTIFEYDDCVQRKNRSVLKAENLLRS
jgi:hypothetical protein